MFKLRQILEILASFSFPKTHQRQKKASVATRKLSTRMDSEVADAFRLFDMVGKIIVFHCFVYTFFVFGFWSLLAKKLRK